MRTTTGLATIFGMCLALCGCQESGIDLGEFGTVHGRVTYKGLTLNEGMITFNCPASGQVATADIQSDGTYAMNLGQREGIPLGDYQISIRPPLAKLRSRPGSQDSDEDSREIPEKYRFETSSGFSATVQSGDNEFDFNMK